MHPRGETADRVIARLAARGHGVVTRSELLRAGVSAGAIRGRVRRGALIREYAGVYRVGHRAASPEATYLAAVKACGAGAVLSGCAAAWLFRLVKGRPPPPEVTAPRPHDVQGLVTRCCRSLPGRDVTTHRGIPVTSVPAHARRLAAVLGEDELARTCHEAGVLYAITPAQIRPRANAPGIAKLRRGLHGDVHVTLSALEREFVRRLAEARLPPPRTNTPAGSKLVDCRWPAERLTVELDSYRFHNSRRSWQQDHRRAREAYARGDEFRRYAWTDVFEDPEAMILELRGLLRP